MALLPAYLQRLSWFRTSQLTFWHETPEINPRATAARLGEYYMLFREKADYSGHYDDAGIPNAQYHGAIGLQYNPIAIAQWGLANYNYFCETGKGWHKTLKAADWLASNLEQNAHGLWVWNHHFDWDYRDTLGRRGIRDLLRDREFHCFCGPTRMPETRSIGRRPIKLLSRSLARLPKVACSLKTKRETSGSKNISLIRRRIF